MVTMITGYLLVGVLPKRMAHGIYERMVRRRKDHRSSGLERDAIVERMEVLLDGHRSGQDVREFAERFHEGRFEDTWGRWQASHKANWDVRTEVVGLEHVSEILDRGYGVVFWGMSFCGTLYSKIALARAGIELVQLSTSDHGASYPTTVLGNRIVGPMHCHPENRYLRDRIRIPDDGNNSYLKQIGEVLKNQGCIWIAGERSRVKKLVPAELLGHIGQFPVGAPMLALRHNAGLLSVHTQRLGRFHYRVTIEPEILLDRKNGRTEAVNQAVQAYATRLASRILENPGDWDWDYGWVENLLMNRFTGDEHRI